MTSFAPATDERGRAALAVAELLERLAALFGALFLAAAPTGFLAAGFLDFGVVLDIGFHN